MRALLFQPIFSLRNVILSLWKNSPKTFIIGVIFSITSLLGVYFALWKGMSFIISLGEVGTIIIKKIIFILFFILFFMVALSFGTLFYGLMFKSRETLFLLTLPIKEEKIIFYKFIETFVLVSWIPVMGTFLFFLAYAQVGRANILLPLFSPLYTAPFFFISCFLGYLAAIFIVRFFNLKKFFLTLALILPVIFLAYIHFKPHREEQVFFFLSEEIAFLKLAQIWFLPFSWPAHGLISFEDYYFKKSLIYLANLWSLSFLLLASIPQVKESIIKIFHRQISSSHFKAAKSDYLSIFISKWKILPSHTRSFIIKDIKLFCREPGLWLQFLIFFGILFFYFINLRNFSYHLLDPSWRNLITFLNLFSILCTISSMCVRFIFPQWSIEGRNFWIIKLTPISLIKIFWEKLFLSFIVTSFVAISLIIMSNYMLKLDGLFFKLTVFIVFISTFTLVNVSLGYGAFFANFKQEYYLKAVESFGGFITLVFNFGYTFLTITVFLIVTHLYFIGKLPNFFNIIKIILILWSICSLLISFVIPWIGLKKLDAKEY